MLPSLPSGDIIVERIGLSPSRRMRCIVLRVEQSIGTASFPPSIPEKVEQGIGAGRNYITIDGRVVLDIEERARLATLTSSIQKKVAERIHSGTPHVRVAIQVVGDIEASLYVRHEQADQGSIHATGCTAG